MEKRRGVFKIFMVTSDERDHLEKLCINGKIIIKRFLKKYEEGAWTELNRLSTKTSIGLLSSR